MSISCFPELHVNLSLDNALSVGYEAFYNCVNINAIAFGKSIERIGRHAFQNSNLKALVFKDKTLDEVKNMENYPWDIKDESIITVQ